MTVIVIIIIAILLCIFIKNFKREDETDIREYMDKMAQEANERRHRMVDNPKFPLVGGCVDCTFRNYAECEKSGYDTEKVCYCDKFKQFVNLQENCSEFIHEGNTIGMQDFVNAFKDN